MIDSNKMIVKDENGQEKEMEILFTFESDELNAQYVVFTDPQDEDGEVFASRYNDEGELEPIETEAEWEMIEEVVGAFSDEMNEYEEETDGK
ncbi:MAG: DUF1292 domain-containing protein [Erysipelotrichaceae bacterium]|nr:DUF1292 domain-containing protein [Erysipelotrichaceae bacterium]